MVCRYWAILLENLRRAVDDLYKTCEGDESCMYAREVIMHLDNYTKDFKSLVHRLKTMVEYENTPPPQRPSSLTWDIRKTSPMGKVTPASTPGKLTPTKHLLLCSPAKRQLNFESDLEVGLRTVRSRQVSETIREVGLEADCSPHQSWQDLQKQEVVVTNDNDDSSNQQVLKVSSESDENGSEHEKSDSEQEKDAAQAPTTVDEISPAPNPKEESEEKADQMTLSTDSTISEPEPTSKSSSNGDLSRVKKSSKTGKLSSNRVGAMNKTNATSKTSKSSVKSSDKITKSIDKTATTKSVTVSTSSALKSTTATTITSQTASSKRDKSADQVKSHVRPTSSFASKVKSSTSSSSSSTASNPKMTRAKTTITSNSKPLSAGAAVPRKTAAGLLITTTARAKAPSSAPASQSSRSASKSAVASAASGSSSPKTQRISLVARQAKFANEKKVPGKKAKFDLSRPRSGLGSGIQTPKPDLNDGNNNSSRPPPQASLVGSNTSLSSGSSNRSYADSVRAGLSHHSVEDLSINISE